MSTLVLPLQGGSGIRGTGLVLALALLSSMVLAQTASRLTATPDYDNLDREQVFDDHQEWRSEPGEAYEFRAEPRAESGNSRFRFGFDPQFEGARRKGEPLFGTPSVEFGDERPTTILRFDM